MTASPAARLVHDGPATSAAGAQRAALVWAVVRDGVEGAVDVVDTDTVPPDRHQFVCSGRDFADGRNDVLTALR